MRYTILALIAIVLTGSCKNKSDIRNEKTEITLYGSNGVIIKKWSNCELMYNGDNNKIFIDSAGNEFNISGTILITQYK